MRPVHASVARRTSRDGIVVGDLEAALLQQRSSVESLDSADSTASRRASPRGSPRTRQALLDLLMAALDGDEGPTYYTFPSLVNYLAIGSTALSDGAFFDTLRAAALKILNIAGGAPVYLADGKAFVTESLAGEFPELAVFRITVAEAFAESRLHPGLWIETRRFADLHTLSRMRRALKTTGLVQGAKIAEVVGALLGLETQS